jgi:opacity protein-like surface antigen
MKKLFVFVAFLMIAASGLINAQLFIGGYIGFRTSGGSEDNGNGAEDKTSSLNVDFGPMAGYFLSDNLAAGVKIVASLDRTKTPPFYTGADETINTQTTFGILPFLRYYALQLNKFSVFGQAQAGLTFGSSKTKTGSTKTDGPKTTTIGISVFPGIAFDISDHVALEAQINLFNLGFSIKTEKLEAEGVTTKETTRMAGFGFDMDNIATTGAISVGAIYKF